MADTTTPALMRRLGTLIRLGNMIVARGGVVTFVQGSSSIRINIANGTIEGPGASDCTIQVSPEDLQALASGRISRVEAVLAGRLNVEGTSWHASALVELCMAVSPPFATPHGLAAVLGIARDLSQHGGCVCHDLGQTGTFSLDCVTGQVSEASSRGPSSAGLHVTLAHLQLIANGDLDRVRAVMSGQLRVTGDTWLAFALCEGVRRWFRFTT